MNLMGTSSVVEPTWTAVAGSYFGYLLFVCFAVAVHVQGPAFALPALFVLVLVPILDMLAGESRDEFSKDCFSPLQRALLAAAPIGFVIGHAIVIVVTAVEIERLNVLEKGLIVLSVGMIGSIGVTAAHELVHKPGTLQKLFGRLGLLNVCYSHFEINHIEGHHVWLGTDRDESTAWLCEPLHRFILRTIPRCLRLSWVLEVKRLRHRGCSIVSARNRMLQYLATQLAYLGLLAGISGTAGVMFFFGQAVVAIFMLESVAYIEHYGLLRERLPNGRYTAMAPAHSWDSYHRFSNYLEFQLQRHADHHTAPARAQELLRASPAAPRLPAGYPVMISLAMIPPLWRSVIHPRLPPAIRDTAAGKI